MDHHKTIEQLNLFLQGLPISIYIIPFILHAFSCVLFIQYKTKSLKFHAPLYDVIISNTPDFSCYNYIPNLLLFLLTSFLIIPLFITQNLHVFLSLFKYFSIIIFLRSITVPVTILPPIKNTNKCNIHLNIPTFLSGHSLDKIFSGHTSFSLLLVFVYYKFSIFSLTFLYFLLFIQIAIALSLIVTREHYTIDVLLGYLIAIPILLIVDV